MDTTKPDRRPPRPPRGWRHRGFLPHLDAPDTVQAITFRLADSLPRPVYERLAATGEAGLTVRVDAEIDRGLGRCLLADPRHAQTVADALAHFDGERYRLIAWVVMPNHVHVVIAQIAGFRLSEIVQGWKSVSARRIKAAGVEGAIWAPDYFDRYVRDEAHLEACVRYTENNPVKAGLPDRPEAWPFSSASRQRE